jgi:proteasome lid subunit RPN8/RPN11
MLPEEQFAAVRNMRAEGVRMLAIWHSHPATPARMSEEDLRLAYTPDTVYMVLSLADAAGPDLRGYVLEDGRPVRVDVVIRPSLPDTRNGIPSHGGAPT